MKLKKSQIMFLLLIGFMLLASFTSHSVYARNGQYGFEPLEASAQSAQQVDLRPAIYLAPTSDLIFSESRIVKSNIHVVDTHDDFINYLQANPDISIVYIHAEMMPELSANLLQEQYNKGRLIVAVNAPISSLGFARF
ncbi:hypothetical protein MNBD_CHLOROFLEXI01-5379 [hydrothermal vent metagenome]|uniref:Uncharacterized protein n=1 Tax=hydrothermal vent metagenome TaxID=652676 RepID=A0A3B0UWX3_9ZZZZ